MTVKSSPGHISKVLKLFKTLARSLHSMVAAGILFHLTFHRISYLLKRENKGITINIGIVLLVLYIPINLKVSQQNTQSKNYDSQNNPATLARCSFENVNMI